MSRRALATALLLLGFLLGWVARDLKRPSYPNHWNLIQLGMTPTEVLDLVPQLDPSLRHIKGFDQIGIDYGKSYWQLLVSYDANLKVSSIEKKYIDRRLGLFNKSLITDY